MRGPVRSGVGGRPFNRIVRCHSNNNEVERMRTVVTIALVLIVAGCASARQTYTSEGKVGHSLNCSGTARSWGMCYEKAGELCGAKGYVVLEKSGEQGAIASATPQGGFASSTHSRSMIIQCKE